MFLENLKSNSPDQFLDHGSIEITLTFIGKNLNKDEISTILETEPTFSWNPNEILEIGSSKRIKITDTGKWYLKSVYKIEDLNIGLKSFFKKLPHDNNLWLKLTKKYETFIEVTAYQDSWNHTYNISSKTLLLLANKNIALSFDIYNLNADETNEEIN